MWIAGSWISGVRRQDSRAEAWAATETGAGGPVASVPSWASAIPGHTRHREISRRTRTLRRVLDGLISVTVTFPPRTGHQSSQPVARG